MSEVAGPSTSSGSPGSLQSRMADRMNKLRDLHVKRNECRKLNHAEVVEEDRRAKEPKNMEARKRRAEYVLQEEELKQKCEEEGKNFEREKLRHVGADYAEALDKRKRGKMNQDEGFSSFEAATFRKYNGLVKQIQPDMDEYENKKQRTGEDNFYAVAGSVVQGTHRDIPENINKMAEDVERQISKREKFSRRRKYNDDADIDYINERNMKFNQKLERFYGKYTKDIKDNLERGTAV